MPYWGNLKDRKTLRKFFNPLNLYTKNSPFHVCVTSYQFIVQDQKTFKKVNWQYMILDEAHSIKNVNSIRWNTLLEFSCRNKLLLTGTPIQNSMSELWALLHFIMPNLFNSHDHFQEWFSKDIEAHSQEKGELNQEQLQRLHKILKPFMLRRIKKDVENEIGPKTEIEINCEMNSKQLLLYNSIRKKLNNISDLFSLTDSKLKVDNLMNLVMQLRKVCNHPELFERKIGKIPFNFRDLSINNYIKNSNNLTIKNNQMNKDNNNSNNNNNNNYDNNEESINNTNTKSNIIGTINANVTNNVINSQTFSGYTFNINEDNNIISPEYKGCISYSLPKLIYDELIIKLTHFNNDSNNIIKNKNFTNYSDKILIFKDTSNYLDLLSYNKFLPIYKNYYDKLNYYQCYTNEYFTNNDYRNIYNLERNALINQIMLIHYIKWCSFKDYYKKTNKDLNINNSFNYNRYYNNISFDLNINNHITIIDNENYNNEFNFKQYNKYHLELSSFSNILYLYNIASHQYNNLYKSLLYSRCYLPSAISHCVNVTCSSNTFSNYMNNYVYYPHYYKDLLSKNNTNLRLNTNIKKSFDNLCCKLNCTPFSLNEITYSNYYYSNFKYNKNNINNYSINTNYINIQTHLDFNVNSRYLSNTMQINTSQQQASINKKPIILSSYDNVNLIYNIPFEEKGFNNIEFPSFEKIISESSKLKILDSLLIKLYKDNHRVLIFCQMTKMIDILEEYMQFRKYSYYRMDGSTNISDRRDMVNDFQTSDRVFAFLLSTRAGGLGVNLTAADVVIFYDNDWNPTMDAQATDRAHRIGQTKPVLVYRLITKNSIEERILKRAKQKQNVQTTVYSGGAFKADIFKQSEIVGLLYTEDEVQAIEEQRKKIQENMHIKALMEKQIKEEQLEEKKKKNKIKREEEKQKKKAEAILATAAANNGVKEKTKKLKENDVNNNNNNGNTNNNYNYKNIFSVKRKENIIDINNSMLDNKNLSKMDIDSISNNDNKENDNNDNYFVDNSINDSNKSLNEQRDDDNDDIIYVDEDNIDE